MQAHWAAVVWLKTLFDIMEWEEGLKYRFRGSLWNKGDNKLMLFELDEPEMIKKRKSFCHRKKRKPRAKRSNR